MTADCFSARASEYAACRPGYPPALFSFLASQCPHHDLAWDCGTGNGQAAVGLVEHFRRVHATDPSQAQLTHARRHPRIDYHLTDEAHSGLPSGSADLVTAAQAAHWFDLDAFYREARRVGRPGVVIALWCYGLPGIAPAIDRMVRDFHDHTVGPDWPPGRELVVGLYRAIHFPFDEIAAPALRIEQTVDLAGFIGYVRTWSAVTRHEARTGTDPVPALRNAIIPFWGDESVRRSVAWPIGVRVGRIWSGDAPAGPPVEG